MNFVNLWLYCECNGRKIILRFKIILILIPFLYYLLLSFQVVYCGPGGRRRYSQHQPVPTKTTRSGSSCDPDIVWCWAEVVAAVVRRIYRIFCCRRPKTTNSSVRHNHCEDNNALHYWRYTNLPHTGFLYPQLNYIVTCQTRKYL